MTGYILSILGIIVIGILIDVIVPNGAINKYIKSIYSIFVVAVLINPIFGLVKKAEDFTLKYQDFTTDQKLLEYIYSKKAAAFESEIELALSQEGFLNVDIILNYSIENDNLSYSTCVVNLKNIAINEDKQHINKYEFIKSVVKEKTNLTYEEIIINEWERKETAK